MNNQAATAILLIIVISMFSIKNMKIIKTDLGTQVSFGKVSLSFLDSADIQPAATVADCPQFFEKFDDLVDSSNIQAATLSGFPDHQRLQVETIIETLSSTYNLENRPIFMLKHEQIQELNGPFSDLYNQLNKE